MITVKVKIFQISIFRATSAIMYHLIGEKVQALVMCFHSVSHTSIFVLLLK